MELEVGIELRNKIQESENKKTVSFLKRRDQTKDGDDESGCSSEEKHDGASQREKM